jgi:hypothetical protein
MKIDPRLNDVEKKLSLSDFYRLCAGHRVILILCGYSGIKLRWLGGEGSKFMRATPKYRKLKSILIFGDVVPLTNVARIREVIFVSTTRLCYKSPGSGLGDLDTRKHRGQMIYEVNDTLASWK